MSISMGILLGILIFFITLSFLSILLDKYALFPKEEFSFLEGDKSSTNKVLILDVNGLILNQSKQGIPILNSQIIYASQIEKVLNNVLDNTEIKAVIISMNSPGGSVSGSNRLYNAIKDFTKNNTKPIYIHTNELLASGAFWSSVAANKVYASYGSMIGSIGVKGPSWFVYNKPKSIRGGFFEPSIETEGGIEHYQPIAGKSKDVFNPFRKPTEEELVKIQKLLDSIYDKFLNVVSNNRKIEKKYIEEKIGAMIYDSQEAKNLKLIDGVISLKNLKNKLINDLNIEEDYQIINITNKYSIINELTNINYKSQKIIKNDICHLYNQDFSVIGNYNFSACEN
tara:strand:+ start:251 stop:1270 length:1020 start_codon:yes stop_codon:yes gene_type:complete